ncbi:MAG: T9SS type A sorting domain-containing protein [Candidatus Kapabacteria bacterium]|nr:MAG: FG-GAP repeat protein [Chlorobi bacterium OLB7]MBX7216137.1 T9SS type A sorting domain-containing protein [Candidatus Kapabacteria bacterium]
MKLSYIILVLLLLATASTTLHAQASDTILPNPNAVLLRKIWMIRGETTGPNAYTSVGEAAGAIPDLNGDSLSEFVVRVGKADQWRIYLGRYPYPDTIPFWTFTGDSTSPPRPAYPLFGNLKGDNQQFLCLGQHRFHDSPERYRLYIFSVTNGIIEPIPSDTLDPLQTMNPPVNIAPTTGYIINLDQETGDELVLTAEVTLRNKQRSTNAELWFFKGGPDFQVNQPTKIIVDPDENDDRAYSTAFADFDGDHFLDMVIGCGYPSGPKLKIWYGRDGSPWNWNSTPDRVIPSLPGFPWFSNGITSLDSDGDSIADILVNGNYLFRSASGKNFRSRSFQVDDADQQLQSPDFFVRFNAGPLNNSNHRFDMIALVRPGQDRFASSELRLFSGGPAGVNTTYDAFYSTHSDGMIAGNSFQHVVPLADCNGDGWSDLLVADPKWWGFDQGIAIILAGGPYIPNDNPSVDVEQLPAEGKSNAISLWPNPVRDQLNIAWHGGLSLPPARIAIHDLTGRLVASGTTDPSVGAAVWHADAVADGTYFLTLYDRNGAVVASRLFSKQE